MGVGFSISLKSLSILVSHSPCQYSHIDTSNFKICQLDIFYHRIERSRNILTSPLYFNIQMKYCPCTWQIKLFNNGIWYSIVKFNNARVNCALCRELFPDDFHFYPSALHGLWRRTNSPQTPLALKHWFGTHRLTDRLTYRPNYWREAQFLSCLENFILNYNIKTLY